MLHPRTAEPGDYAADAPASAVRTPATAQPSPLRHAHAPPGSLPNPTRTKRRRRRHQQADTAGADPVSPKLCPSTALGGTTDVLTRPPRPRRAKRILLSWVLAAYLPPLVAVPDCRPATSTHWFREAGPQNDGPSDADAQPTAHRCIELRLWNLRAPGPRLSLARSSDVLLTCVDEALGLPHGRTAGLIHRATLKRLRTDTDFLLQFLTWSDAFEERWGFSFTLPPF